MTLLAPISWGELIDKITILEIKAQRLSSPAALANVRRELDGLNAIADLRQHPEIADLKAELSAINARLWDIEDAIRAKEAAHFFDRDFIELARSVYRENDHRGRIKRDINRAMNSEIVEEKQYTSYD
jgi:alpha/beta superfamily hydrolase